MEATKRTQTVFALCWRCGGMALQEGAAFLHVRTFGTWVDGLSSKDTKTSFRSLLCG